MVTSLQKVFRRRSTLAAVLTLVLELSVMLGATPALAKGAPAALAAPAVAGQHLPFKGTLQALEKLLTDSSARETFGH